MKESPIILSVLGQALATTNERDLMKMIRIVHNELESLIDEFDEEYLDTGISYSSRKAQAVIDDYLAAREKSIPVLEIGEHKIEAVTFTD
jgi:hypothetical protein